MDCTAATSSVLAADSAFSYLLAVDELNGQVDPTGLGAIRGSRPEATTPATAR